MSPSQEITDEDVESLLNRCTEFEILMAVGAATWKMETEKLRQQEEAASSSTPAAYGRGECSSSTAPKEKIIKRNPVQNGGHGRQPWPPLPEEFKNKIQEVARGRSVTPATLVIQKKLYITDVNHGLNRLTIPRYQIRNMDFLTEDEKRNLGGKIKKPMEVKIIEPSMQLNDVQLSQRDTSTFYVIIGNWSSIVKKNGLKVGMEVQLWSFRVDSRLYFALVRLSRKSTTEL